MYLLKKRLKKLSVHFRSRAEMVLWKRYSKLNSTETWFPVAFGSVPFPSLVGISPRGSKVHWVCRSQHWRQYMWGDLSSRRDRKLLLEVSMQGHGWDCLRVYHRSGSLLGREGNHVSKSWYTDRMLPWPRLVKLHLLSREKTCNLAVWIRSSSCFFFIAIFNSSMSPSTASNPHQMAKKTSRSRWYSKDVQQRSYGIGCTWSSKMHTPGGWSNNRLSANVSGLSDPRECWRMVSWIAWLDPYKGLRSR